MLSKAIYFVSDFKNDKDISDKKRSCNLRMKATTSHIWEINKKSQKKGISFILFHFDTSIFLKQASEDLIS